MSTFEREIICFDLETTGLQAKDHSIVQFACVILNTSLQVIEEYKTYIKPPAHVVWSPKAIEVTGITPDTVKDSPTFKEAAKTILGKFKDRDILTHNGNVFDLPFIATEFDRVGEYFNIDNINVYDTLYIESLISSRKLDYLYNKYTGCTMEDSGLQAHDALSDVLATASVFKGQTNIFDVNTSNTTVSLDKMIGYNDGELVMMVGKYKGDKIYNLLKKDPDYVAWMVKESGSPRIFNLVKELYLKVKNEG